MPPKEDSKERDCKSLEYLRGPVELDYLRDPSGAEIVLFGDVHVSKSKCPRHTPCQLSIYQYLHALFSNYDNQKEILDFFLEIDFEPTIRQKYPSRIAAKRREEYLSTLAAPRQNYLTASWEVFELCLQRTKKQCEFRHKPIRFHYADIRRGVVHSGIDETTQAFVKELQNFSNIKHPGELRLKHVDAVQGLLDRLRQKDVAFLFKISKIGKQIKHLPTDVQLALELEVLEYLSSKSTQTEIELNQRKLAVLREALEEKKVVLRFDADTFTLSIFGQILSPLFDVYVIARILRHKMRRVIVYAGAAHTRAISWILRKYFGYEKVPKYSRQSWDPKTSYQCLDMQGVPPGLFV